MKNSKLAPLIVALSITSFWDRACAQNEPPPAPPQNASPCQTPLNEQATAEAWAAFRAGENERAITNADQCIARFGEAANRIQAILEEEKATLPKGAVSEADKKRIARYQILHDVATCFLIKGWAEEKLGHKEEARKAYTEARKYTHARSSMPTGESLWSPAEKASESLAKLQ
jgi:tetratricopeptide (TPR) repeat protein